MGSKEETDWGVLAIPALQHFLVDALCVCCLYMLVTTRPFADQLSLFLMYNVLAFLTQPLTGSLADILKHKHWLLLASLLLLTTAVLFVTLFPLLWGRVGEAAFLVPLFLGMGNSLFHVWGGQLVTVQTRNDTRSLSIFVSTGAFGLAVGAVFASWSLLYCLLVAYCGTILVCPLWRVSQPSSEPSPIGKIRGMGGVLCLLLVLAFVVFRSKISTTFSAGLEQTQQTILLLGGIAMAGKGFGGFLCKLFGMFPAIVLMLVVTAICLFFPYGSSSFSPFLGLFAVSCTMPVTLYLANRLLPGREGLSFGLLAAALMPGYLMAVGIDTDSILPYGIALSATVLLELAVLWFLYERRMSVLCSSVVVNVLTNVPLNLLILRWGVINDFAGLLVAEGLIVLIEATWYFCFVRQWRQAFIYSLLCNAVSFLTGLLVQMVVNYY